jgi:hypothetical protein
MKTTFTKNGLETRVKKGFSWVNLFFGFLVPLFHGDIARALLELVVGIFTAGISWFIFPFFYNKHRANRLVDQGWVVKQ